MSAARLSRHPGFLAVASSVVERIVAYAPFGSDVEIRAAKMKTLFQQKRARQLTKTAER
jgi:hypothetical protein